MSIINDDKKKTGKTGRNQPLKDSPEQDLEVQVSKRDQVPQKLKAQLEKIEMGTKIVRLWETGNSDRTEWLQRQQMYLSDWDEFLVSSAEGPFQQSSSLHLPMPLIVAKTLHARFLQALLGYDPSFTVKARREDSSEQAPLVQNVMRYALNDWANENEGATEALDMWVWDWVTTGVGLLKIRWDAKFQRYVDVEEKPVPGTPEFIVTPDGEQRSIPTIVMAEEEVIKTEKVFEGPIIERVEPEDVLIVGGGGNPQKADAVIQQIMMTASDLWTYADRKVFDAKVVKEIIDGGPDAAVDDMVDNIKQQRQNNAGLNDPDSDIHLDRYKILECYLSADVDGSGINSEVVVWVHKVSGKILRSTYLHRISKTGTRPFFKVDFLKRPNQAYGIGIVEMLHPLSVELDAMHNMRIDFGLLSTMPFGFYRPTSSIDPEVINLEPGALIPVDNPQTDIVFPNLGNRTYFGAQEEGAINTLVERLTGISDLSLGVLSGNQGATRTATGTRALVGELSSNLDVYLRRLNLGWKKALEFLLHMLQQRIPNGLSFRITGESGHDYWGKVKQRNDLAGDYDLEISANSTTSNPQIQQQIASELVQMTGNPLDIQLGIITPRERYESLKNWAKSRGVVDFGKYLRQPQGISIQLSPLEELNRVVRGQQVPVTPEMDHQGYIQLWEEFKATDELLGQFNEQETILAEVQARRHAQMLQAIQQQAAQVRNQQQIQANAQLAQNPPSAGMNPLQGGSGQASNSGQ